MNEMTKGWIGKKVSIALRSWVLQIPTTVQGVLLELNESFVLIDKGGNKPLLIPVASVLHMEPLAE